MKKKKLPTTMGWVPTQEDVELIIRLRDKYEPRMGPVTVAMVVRMGIRKLAEYEGVLENAAS